VKSVINPDKAPYYSLFRVIGELRNSCIEAEEELNLALKNVAKLSKDVALLDKILMQKYNYEFKDEGQKSD